MDKLGHFVQLLESRKLLPGKLRGVFHLLVGRKIQDASGAEVSGGATWREVAGLFKDLRIDPQLIVSLGLDPAVVSPRDRRRCWYSAIAAARPDSPQARAEAEHLIAALKPLGYTFNAPPALSKPSLSSPPPAPVDPADEAETPKKPVKKPRKGQ
jgi:hypothetical protein